MADIGLPDPGFTPYYSAELLKIIKDIKNNFPLNLVYMTVKEWYRVLLEMNVTKHEIDEEGRMELISCWTEERNPQFEWSETYRLSRLKCPDPDTKSFLFQLVNQLFPSKNREAGEAVMRVSQAYDRNLIVVKSLRLEIKTDEPFTLPTVAILATGLLFVRENRKQRKQTTLFMMRLS